MTLETQEYHLVDESKLDAALEYESLSLLSELEQFAIHLDEKMVQSSPRLVLEYLIKIANRSAEFSLQLPDNKWQPFSLDILIVQDQQGHMYITKNHVCNNKLTKDLINELDDTYSDILNLQTFRYICQDILRIIKVYLLFNARSFHCQVTAQQWKKLYGSFFLNLAKTVEDMYSVHSGV